MSGSYLTHDPARLLQTLEALLALEVSDIPGTLTQTCNILAETFHAEKVDILLYQPEDEILLALGTSQTGLGHLQHALGLHRLPLTGGGRTVEVFVKGTPYWDNHVDQDPGELEGIKVDLGVKSAMGVPLLVAGERRGVLLVASDRPHQYDQGSMEFLSATVRWVGEITHRAEVVEQLQREAAEQARRVAADEVLTVMAHDFKNFLSPLALRLAFLRHRAAQEGRIQEQEQLQEAEQTLHYLRTLVDSLLDVARLDEGIFVLRRLPEDMEALVTRTVDALRISGVAISVTTSGAVVAEVDRVRVQMAVGNLISNAVLHARATRPIQVDMRQGAVDDGAAVEITVSDDGPGIDPEVLDHLFTRFAAGRQSTGLGIGLYVARQVAEAHGGTLTVESAPDRGTTFTVRLPIHP